MAEPVRLSKRVAALVPCSRREAEQYIEGGWVRVDGDVVEEPQFRVSDTQRVELDRGATSAALEPVTIVLHKPAGVAYGDMSRLLPEHRSSEDRSGIRSVKRHFTQLTPLLSLPAPASGLAVYSQDRRIVRKLTQDAMHVEQELVAEVAGNIAPGGLALLCHGLSFEGLPLPPAKVSWQNETRLRFAIKGIAPERIEWMCAQAGLRLVGLKRIRLGRLPMAGLAPGQWRYLAPDERF